MSSRLARSASRGALINFGFALAIQGLGAIQAVVVPRLVGPEGIGLFAVAMGGVGLGAALKELGLPKKLIQEREVDLHTSYAVAFTLEMMLAAVFLLVVLAVAPVLSIVFHRTELWALTSLLGMSIFTIALVDLPAALPHRELRYVKRNALLAVAPVATFAVTVPAAFAGLGVWSLALGTVAGFVAAALVIFFASDIKPRLLWDRPVMRRYITFGWPIWAGQLVAVAAGWGTMFAVSSTLGIAGVGFFQLATGWGQQALKVDNILITTVYPALTSIQTSPERLRRAFNVTNQLSMLWAGPVALGTVVFAGPAIQILLGDQWTEATVLVRAVGAGVAVDAIGYNWNLFLAARGETRPQLITSLLAAAWLVCIVIPLLLLFGINGAAASIVVLSTAGYLMRSYYMRRLFGPFFMVGVVWRQLTAALIAAAAVLAVRRIGWDVHDVGGLAGQGAFFLAVFALLAFALGRAPILEVWRALRAEPAPPSQAAVAASTVGVMPTPRPMAFPLGLAFDADGPRGPAVWVTTRDWPALGRFDVDDGRWTWTELPPFPHVPTPDGRGGCWTALSRSSAVAHIDGNGDVRRIDVGSSRELLVSALGSGALWVVDAHQRELIAIDLETEAFERLSLPASMHRPDYVAALSDGAVWVADTQSRIVARLDPTTREMDEITVPHPTRALRADARRHGVWLGASDRPCLTLLGRDGRVRRSVDLSGVPFGIDLSEDGRLFVALKDEDSIAVVHPDAEVVDVLPVRQGSVPMTVAVGAGRCFVALAHSSEIGVLPLSAPTHDAEAAWQARPDGLVTPTGLGGLPASPPPPLVD